ncbi:hypothetical protein KDK77_07530, partial [bacterium]|nr:hypothetical protein [bacterium]
LSIAQQEQISRIVSLIVQNSSLLSIISKQIPLSPIQISEIQARIQSPETAAAEKTELALRVLRSIRSRVSEAGMEDTAKTLLRSIASIRYENDKQFHMIRRELVWWESNSTNAGLSRLAAELFDTFDATVHFPGFFLNSALVQDIKPEQESDYFGKGPFTVTEFHEDFSTGVFRNIPVQKNLGPELFNEIRRVLTETDIIPRNLFTLYGIKNIRPEDITSISISYLGMGYFKEAHRINVEVSIEGVGRTSFVLIKPRTIPKRALEFSEKEFTKEMKRLILSNGEDAAIADVPLVGELKKQNDLTQEVSGLRHIKFFSTVSLVDGVQLVDESGQSGALFVKDSETPEQYKARIESIVNAFIENYFNLYENADEAIIVDDSNPANYIVTQRQDGSYHVNLIDVGVTTSVKNTFDPIAFLTFFIVNHLPTKLSAESSGLYKTVFTHEHVVNLIINGILKRGVFDGLTYLMSARESIQDVRKDSPEYVYLVGNYPVSGVVLDLIATKISNLLPPKQQATSGKVLQFPAQGTQEEDLFADEFFQDRLAADFTPPKGIEPKDTSDDNKNLARRGVQDRVDAVLKQNIEAGNAVRVQLRSLVQGTETQPAHQPEEFVKNIFFVRRTIDGRTIDIPVDSYTLVDRLSKLFGEINADAKENLRLQIASDFGRARLQKALTLAFEILQNSKYSGQFAPFSLTVLMDWDDIFYSGKALAHVGTERRTVYLNLNTLLHIAELDFNVQPKAKYALQAVIEHEYRDYIRSLLNKPRTQLTQEEHEILLSNDQFWLDVVQTYGEPDKNTDSSHRDDIGAIDPIYFEGEKITFKDVENVWTSIEQAAQSAQHSGTKQSEYGLVDTFRISAKDMPVFEISATALEQLGVTTPGAFLSLLSKAIALEKKKVKTVFPNPSLRIQIDSIPEFVRKYLAPHGIDIRKVAPRILEEPLGFIRDIPRVKTLIDAAMRAKEAESQGAVVGSEIGIPDYQQLKGILEKGLPSDFFMVSPVFNEKPSLIQEVIQHAHSEKYLNRLVIIDDASSMEGTREALMMLNDRFTIKDLELHRFQLEQDLIYQKLTEAQKEGLKRRIKAAKEAIEYRRNPSNPVYSFHLVLREKNGRRTGAIQETILGLYAMNLVGDYAAGFPEKLFIMDGDSYIRGRNVIQHLKDAANLVGQVDTDGKRIIATILPVSVSYGLPDFRSFWKVLDYIRFAFIRSLSAHGAKSVPGGGGGYSTPYLIRAISQHSGIFETDDAELSAILRANQGTKFKFFARKTMRVITDMPETLSAQFKQARRWSGGMLILLRKYRDNMPKIFGQAPWAVLIAGLTILGIFATLGYLMGSVLFTTSFAFSTLIDLFTPLMPIFGVFTSMIIGAVLAWGKGQTRQEKMMVVLLSPLLAVGFVGLSVFPLFAEAIETVKSLAFELLGYVGNRLKKFIPETVRTAFVGLRNWIGDAASAFSYKKNPFAPAYYVGAGTLFTGIVSGIVASVMNSGFSPEFVVMASTATAILSSLGTFKLMQALGFKQASAPDIEEKAIAGAPTRAFIPADIRSDSRRTRPTDTSLARKEVNEQDVHQEIQDKINGGRAVRLRYPDIALINEFPGVNTRGFVLDTIQSGFGFTDEQNPPVRRALQDFLSEGTRYSDFQNGMAVLQDVIDDMVGLKAGVLRTDRNRFYAKLFHSVTVLFGHEGDFGSGSVLAHGGRTGGVLEMGERGTIYIHSKVFEHISSLARDDRQYAQALLRALFEHELRDILREEHFEDIGVVDPVPDPRNPGQFIDFEQLNVFWSKIELALIHDRYKELSVQTITAANAEQIGQELKKLSTFIHSRQAHKEFFDQALLEQTVSMADQLFVQLGEYYTEYLIDFFRSALSTDLSTPDAAQSLERAAQQEIRHILGIIHPDRVANISESTKRNADLYTG